MLTEKENLILYPSVQSKDKAENTNVPREEIPPGAREFYHDFGRLIHEKTGKIVEDLADYQYKIWDDKSRYRLIIKSQKVGLSTSCLLEDFQKALTTCKGKQILVIAQSQQHANEHLHTLKRLIYHSDKYRKYLITGSDELTFKEEKTKMSEIFIHNPDDPGNHTRIIGLGTTEGMIWSWKKVGHIHMSDIAANNLKDDSPVFAAAFSRLLSTDGTMIIETPPRGPFKKTFEIYQQSLLQQKDPDLMETQFSVHHVSAQDGVSAGVITQTTLDAERSRLGPTLYAQSYECQFTALTGNLYAQASIDKAVSTKYSLDINPIREKYIVADQGYVSSKFAILIAQWEPYKKRIEILKAEEIEMPTYEQMLNRILRYRAEYGNVLNIGVDATSRMEFAMSLKERIGESNRWPYIKERMEYAKKQGLDIAKMMHVVPFLFSTESKSFMSSHSRRVLDDPRGLIAIDPSFISLITGLRSAVFDEKGQLDKEMTPHDDLVDCFQMLMNFFHFNERR